MSTTSKASEVKAWLQRRFDKGITPNADEVWVYIRNRWPSLSEETLDEIYAKAGY